MSPIISDTAGIYFLNMTNTITQFLPFYITFFSGVFSQIQKRQKIHNCVVFCAGRKVLSLQCVAPITVES